MLEERQMLEERRRVELNERDALVPTRVQPPRMRQR
jgi:hypothetical protein